MGKRIDTPKVNAGSMADIAFLLLIFFLVTTSIENDAGIDRMLPKVEKDSIVAPVKDRNILQIFLNERGELLVEEDLTGIGSLKQIAIDFLDNGGISPNHPDYCSYCKGLKDANSSDNPTKAIISLSSSRNAKYGTYISVQDKLVSAYNFLRNRESKRLYGRNYTNLESDFTNPNISKSEKEQIRIKIKKIQELFPLKITEIETK